jgi:hypothetical protein
VRISPVTTLKAIQNDSLLMADPCGYASSSPVASGQNPLELHCRTLVEPVLVPDSISFTHWIQERRKSTNLLACIFGIPTKFDSRKIAMTSNTAVRSPRIRPRISGICAVTYLVILVALFMSWPAEGEDLPTNKTHNFVFFARERELLPNHPFLKIKRFEGAQITYSWKQLEPREDEYDFADIDADLKVLKEHNKKLWIQLQDTTFMPTRQAVPAYIMKGKEYNGGANPQYNEVDKIDGWVARRWDPAVQRRFHRLIVKLAERYDGIIAGINLQESAIGITEDGVSQAPGFTYLGYRDAIKKNMLAMKQAFKMSVGMQYVNFMPGESLPEVDKGLMKSLFDYGEEIGVAVGAPDLMPKKPYQQAHAYKFMREKKKEGKLRMGVAVQDGNYFGETGAAEPKPGESRRDIVPELANYAKEVLGASYVFWSIQEPYFSENVIPYFSREPSRTVSN